MLSIVYIFMSIELGTKLLLIEKDENSEDLFVIQQYLVLHISGNVHQK